MFVQYRNSITCLWVKEMHIDCPSHQRAESASPGSAHSTVIEVQKQDEDSLQLFFAPALALGAETPLILPAHRVLR